MATTRTWLDEGLRAIAQHGLDALRIDRLTAALGVSKGSFYHHFPEGMAGFQRELLAHYEQQYTTRYIDAVEAEDLSASAKLQLLRRLVIDDETEQPHLEANIRSWAAREDEARRTLERVDATRIEYLRALCEEVSGEPEEAVSMARLLYVMLVGAQHVLPSLSAEQIDQLYDLVLQPAEGQP